MSETATISAQKGEATTPEQETITGQKPAEGTTPSEEKKVAELQGKVESLEKELAQQKTLQSQADRKRRIEEIEKKKLEKQLERIRSGEITIDDNNNDENNSLSSIEKETRLNARIKIQGLLIDNPEYQELLKQDLTLKEVLKNNPFVLIGDFIDEEDAVEQIKEKLDQRISTLGSQNQQKVETQGKEGAKEFEAGVSQPIGEETLKKEEKPYYSILKDPIEESIKSKIKVE